MDDTTSGESHEPGVQVCQRLCQVFTQAMSLVGILWHERYHVDIQHTGVQYQDLQDGILAVLLGGQHSLVFLPVLAVGRDGSLCQQFGVFAPSLGNAQNDADLLGSTCVAEEGGEVVLGTSLDGDTLKALILYAEAFPTRIVVIFLHTLNMETQIGGIVGVNGIVFAHFKGSQRVTRTHLLPRSSGTPAVAFGRAILERAVLYQFGVKAAIGRTTDILEKNTNKVITDSLSPLGGCHGLLGLQTQCRCYE